ncbi:MAG: SGNH/GDSL hydrolase family protein [Gemmatimonadaceae bacterium]|nr:SGNH/GDSL hydrolase family protein [Gemmatimonadaceae bacterium]
MQLGIGIPIGGSGFVPGVGISIFDLGAWDLAALSGNDGDTASGTVSSLVGANVLTPVAAPVIDDVAIGGRRSLICASAASSYLRCDALASRFTLGNAWSVVIRYRATSAAQDQPLFCAGSSASAVNNNFRILQGQLGSIKIISNTVTGGTITRVTANALTQFDEHVLMVTCTTGGTLAVYIDGVAAALDNSAMDPNALTCDRFAIGAFLTTAASAVADGPVQWFGVSSTAVSAANALIFTSQLYSADFVKRKSASKQVMWVGDSITESSVGTTLSAGIRAYELIWTVDNAISLNHVGNRLQGTIPDRENVAQGGASIATIASNVTAAFTADPTLAPDIIILMMGTNDISGGTTASQLALWRTAIGNIYTAAVARNASVKIAASKLTPIQPGTSPADANWVTFNAGLVAATTGEFDVFDAAHPGVLIRLDNAAALGTAWSATDYTADTTHPNEVGIQKIGAAQMLIYGLTLRALSGTLRALSCSIKVPAGGATLTQGTTVTISGRVSRYPSTLVVKKTNGTTLFSAVMNKRTWSYSYTPVIGDVGDQTLTATVTDTLDSSTANSAGVAVTVAAPSYSPADEGNAVLNIDISDAGNITQGAGVCTAVVNKITGIGSSGTSPAYSATAGPGGTTPAITFVGASSQKLVSAADSTFATALSGTQQSWTWKGVVKVTATFGSGFLFSIGSTSVAAHGIAGQASNNYRCYRNPNSNASPADSSALASVSGWALLEMTFDGSANTLTMRVNNGTATVTSSYTTTACTFTRWALGCLADTYATTYGSGSIAEIWMFSDVQTGKNIVSLNDASDRVYNYLNTKWALGLSAR